LLFDKGGRQDQLDEITANTRDLVPAERMAVADPEEALAAALAAVGRFRPLKEIA
jgi:hypothetical protein